MNVKVYKTKLALFNSHLVSGSLPPGTQYTTLAKHFSRCKKSFFKHVQKQTPMGVSDPSQLMAIPKNQYLTSPRCNLNTSPENLGMMCRVASTSDIISMKSIGIFWTTCPHLP